jgi:hypothetical protein
MSELQGYWRLNANCNMEKYTCKDGHFYQTQTNGRSSERHQVCLNGRVVTDEGEANADGSTNFDYCQYCYKDGKFLQDCTMDEMIEHCAQFVDEVNKNMPQPMTKEEYKQMMQQYFPMLKRWRK